jgi:general nucleoside transport system ATP-binding protein
MKVELKAITQCFGSLRANDNISLLVEAGTIHGLLGENGAGKSTLVKILTGLLPCTSGSIYLNDRLVTLSSPADALRLGIGMLHQDPLDFPALSVLENFRIGQKNTTQTNPFRSPTNAFKQLAQTFGFRLNPNDPMGTLSVGERQQVELLRLLALGIQTLILDEPTTGISAHQRETLFTAVRQLAAQGKSIIFVSHKLDDVNALCHQVSVLRQGKLLATLPTPCPDTQILSLMFGQTLAQPTKPPTSQKPTALELKQIDLPTERLHLTLNHLTIHQGEVIGLAGLEGNGQQQLLQLCAGLAHTKTGQIICQGQNLTHATYTQHRQAGIAYFPADRMREGLIQGLSINEHMALRHPAPGWFIHWPQILAKTQQAIATFQIRGTPQTQVEHLSGGNQQRTQLALLPTPLTLLLMEHPTRGLDIESSLWVWQQLIARCQGGTTLLFTSSELDEIMQYSDRILIFSGGKVSEPIPTAELTLERLGSLIGGRIESYQPA